MIPDEAVEAAAAGLAVEAWGEWEYVPNVLRDRFLRDARICLEAAAPYLQSPAWERGVENGYHHRPNPYTQAVEN